jgi:hypothetical protein
MPERLTRSGADDASIDIMTCAFRDVVASRHAQDK